MAGFRSRVADVLSAIKGSTIEPQSVTTADTDTNRIAGERHYASEYDGADADARLDAAINEASGGDAVYLESVDYQTDHTIPADTTLIGTNINGSRFMGGTLTVDGSRVIIRNVGIFTDLVVNSSNVRIKNIYASTGGSTLVTINDDEVVLSDWRGGIITFASGTADCVVDTSTRVSVTDNGNNTVGDIA